MSFIDQLIGKYVCVRSRDAGVFVGVLEEKTGKEVVISKARRIWKWAGAATLSQLSRDGVSKPDECMFPPEVKFIVLPEICEIIPMQEEAIVSITSVKEWLE